MYISVQSPVFHLVEKCTRLKTLTSALWRYPYPTVAQTLLEHIDEVTNLEAVKIQFCHLLFFFFFLSFFFAQPSALTRTVLGTKYPLTVVKFSWQVPFELSF